MARRDRVRLSYSNNTCSSRQVAARSRRPASSLGPGLPSEFSSTRSFRSACRGTPGVDSDGGDAGSRLSGRGRAWFSLSIERRVC